MKQDIESSQPTEPAPSHRAVLPEPIDYVLQEEKFLVYKTVWRTMPKIYDQYCNLPENAELPKTD